MSIKCKEITDLMEELAPRRLAEEWDNAGLLLGDPDQSVNKVLLCLDVTDEVIEEAVQIKADLIISHHPFIFKGIKKIQKNDVKGRQIYKLIKNEIGVYSAHTNLDFAEHGLTEYLAKVLGLSDIKNLKDYMPERLFKVVVFVPEEAVDTVRDAMTCVGAGWIGKYSDCTFATRGIGTFKPLEGTKPYTGNIGSLEKVNEYRLETIISQKNIDKVIEKMLKVHPYEEAAYDIYPLELYDKKYGYGKVGSLKNGMTLENFINHIKEALEIDYVKLIGCKQDKISKVAVFNGSFDKDILDAVKDDIDVLVTGDVKYHDARDIIERNICAIDAGHFGTEHIVLKLIQEKLKSKFGELDVICNQVENDPFKIY